MRRQVEARFGRVGNVPFDEAQTLPFNLMKSSCINECVFGLRRFSFCNFRRASDIELEFPDDESTSIINTKTLCNRY